MHVQRAATMGSFAWLLSRGDARPPTTMSRTYAHDVKGSIKLSRKRVNPRREPMLTRKERLYLSAGHATVHKRERGEGGRGEGTFYRGLTGVYCRNFRRAQGGDGRGPIASSWTGKGVPRTVLTVSITTYNQKNRDVQWRWLIALNLLARLFFSTRLLLPLLVRIYHSFFRLCCLSHRSLTDFK